MSHEHSLMCNHLLVQSSSPHREKPVLHSRFTKSAFHLCCSNYVSTHSHRPDPQQHTLAFRPECFKKHPDKLLKSAVLWNRHISWPGLTRHSSPFIAVSQCFQYGCLWVPSISLIPLGGSVSRLHRTDLQETVWLVRCCTETDELQGPVYVFTWTQDALWIIYQ